MQASTTVAQVKDWDLKLPKDLFKGGPPGRLRDAKCKDCNDAMAKLQAAMDDWYSMELTEGQADKRKAIHIQDNDEHAKVNAAGDAKINQAKDGLGQPKDGGKAAQKKQEEIRPRTQKRKGTREKARRLSSRRKSPSF